MVTMNIIKVIHAGICISSKELNSFKYMDLI